MAEEKMTGVEAVFKAVEGAPPDLLRELLEVIVTRVMGAEVNALCGAGYGERSADRVHARNGYRQRTWDTRLGTIDLPIPKLRQGSYFPTWLLEPRRRVYLRFTGGLFFVALIPTLIFVIWSPQIFSWIFGPQWQTAGVFARSLVFWLMLMLCNLPANLFSRIVRIQRQMFFFDILVLVLRTLALTAGGLYLSASATVMLFSLLGALMNIFYILVIGIILRRKEGEVAWTEVLNDLKEGAL